MSIPAITETKPYLSFNLDEEIFAVDVAKVHEVLEFTTITKIPRVPDFMSGVINLRGSVVPVIDLRMKFGLSKTERTIDTCIIVLEISIEGEKIVIGALADSVQEVFDIEPHQIEPAPNIGNRYKANFIMGMGKRDENFIMILDIDKIFSSEELEVFQEAGSSELSGTSETQSNNS
ncbi:MAG: chemotaxis protein CheW [Ignavibacteria bacterium]|nr:chemotaxis protein CheW [Ignavibacteria bacterium]